MFEDFLVGYAMSEGESPLYETPAVPDNLAQVTTNQAPEVV